MLRWSTADIYLFCLKMCNKVLGCVVSRVCLQIGNFSRVFYDDEWLHFVVMSAFLCLPTTCLISELINCLLLWVSAQMLPFCIKEMMKRHHARRDEWWIVRIYARAGVYMCAGLDLLVKYALSVEWPCWKRRLFWLCLQRVTACVRLFTRFLCVRVFSACVT